MPEPQCRVVSRRQIELLRETENIGDATGQADQLALKLATFEYNLQTFLDNRIATITRLFSDANTPTEFATVRSVRDELFVIIHLLKEGFFNA